MEISSVWNINRGCTTNIPIQARRRGIQELNLQEEESMIKTNEAPINQSPQAELGQGGACLGGTAGRLALRTS
jgi:hypothetical protein